MPSRYILQCNRKTKQPVNDFRKPVLLKYVILVVNLADNLSNKCEIDCVKCMTVRYQIMTINV